MKKKIIIILIPLILLSLIFTIMLTNLTALRRYLEKSGKTDANMLVIESWLPDLATEMAKSEIHNKVYDFIVTTGIASSELDFCMVAMNGYLIFYPEHIQDKNGENNKHKIEIVARSKMGGRYCSHFNFFINDSLITDFIACEKPEKHEVTWNGPLAEIDSLMVQFTNDYVDEQGDRNLYIKEIIIDNEVIIPYQYNSVLDYGIPGGNDRIINNYRSHPEIMRNRLLSGGIDSLKLIAVTGKRTNFNRTLAGALAFRDWLRRSGQIVSGVNIVTMGIHARRTWMTYKRVLGRSVNIGIISIPDYEGPDSKRSEIFETIIETLDLIYYWFILIPY